MQATIPGFCPGGTKWQLLEGSGFTARVIATRDAPGGVGGPPAFGGSKIVWARVSTAPINVTSADIVDTVTGNTRTVTEATCSWIGSTVREVVFSCSDSLLRVYPVTGQAAVTWSTEDAVYIAAEPHAVIGRRPDKELGDQARS